ncbi:astacin [Ancylostoma ceylanicum]|uniref:Metalloendopeptidase n=1 Tax=Ancylostoma ceylanicum TaxID=53326 RepID=A0A0D6M1G5_9BILA|nr:astacin [Ancylostoma ceylanicum]
MSIKAEPVCYERIKVTSIPHVRKWDEVKDDEGNYIIPFVIRGFYVDDEKKLIRDAMDDIGANTCIRFRERRDEETYVEIINKEGEGCSSSLGRLPSGNRLQLEASRIGNCVTKKIVFHELMHIIGMDHEHKRQDRDKYVKIHWENIEEDSRRFFEKDNNIDTYGLPYDFYSITHFGKNEFSMDDTITIETIDKKYQDIIGEQSMPSRNDYRKICLMYGCEKCAAENKGSHTSQ